VQRGAVLRSSLLETAALLHHLPLCQYLKDHGCSWTAHVTNFLLKHRLLRELEWGLSQGIELTAKQQQRYERVKAKQLKVESTINAAAEPGACGERTS
jgi:hypothetical protein